MSAKLPTRTELARRLCYWHRASKNDQARQFMQPRVSTNIDEIPSYLADEYYQAADNLTMAMDTNPGRVIEVFLTLDGVKPTEQAIARHAIVLDWATSPIPE